MGRLLVVAMLGLVLVVAVVTTSVSQAKAADAQLLMLPTRIELEGNQRYASITVKNSGDAPGRYRVTLVDTIMQENGAVTILPEEETAPYSAREMIRISPRSLLLEPGEHQNVRMLVKRSKDLEPGEYRTHLSVKLTDSNVGGEEVKPQPSQTAVSMKPKLVMVIPIIVRHGDNLTYRVSIAEAKLKAPNEKQKHPVLDLALAWEGNRSIIGDFEVTHVTSGGKKEVIKQYPGVAVYRNTPLRWISVPLDESSWSDLQSGTLSITYNTQGKDSEVIAQTELPL